MSTRSDSMKPTKCLKQRSLPLVRPCSVHDPEQAMVYAKKLYQYAEEAKDDLMIVMRVYFEKCVERTRNDLWGHRTDDDLGREQQWAGKV